jgi:hypothetical protein
MQPAPPGHNLYRSEILRQQARREKTAEVLAVKAARMVDPNAFFPKINKASRELAKVADARQGILPSNEQPWHDRLYDRSRKEYIADVYKDAGFEKLSVAEKAYLRTEQLQRERGWMALGGKSAARVALTMPMPPVERGPSPNTLAGQRRTKKSSTSPRGIPGASVDTFAPYSAILSRLSLPRGAPPRAPSLLPPTIDIPQPGPDSAGQQAYSHYGAGAALWMHSSNDVLAVLRWQQPTGASAGRMVLQYQVEYRSRVRTDLLTTTEQRLSEFVSGQVSGLPGGGGTDRLGEPAVSVLESVYID